MKSFRIPRLQSELKKIMNTALTHSVADPNLNWVTITDIQISKDLKYAKVYFSHFNNPATHEDVKNNLVKTSGFFKKLIAGAHIMRTIPELTFYYDETEDRAERIDVLLSTLKDDFDDDAYDPDIDIDDHLDDDYFDIDEDEEIDEYDDYEDDEEEF